MRQPALRLIGPLCLVIVIVLVLTVTGGGQAKPLDPEPRSSVDSWAFAIGSGTLQGVRGGRYADYDLVVLDGQEAKHRHIDAVHDAGGLVLGYLSVGTIERYRPWYRRLKPYRLEAWKDWKGEFFANVRKRGYRRQIARRIAPRLLAKGFDGLFLDNVDMIEGHRRQARGMRKLVRRLSGLVHADGGYLFSQNGYSILGPLIGDLDGWNREDVTATYDFDRDRYRVNGPRRIAGAQRELRKVAEAGLVVTATDYTKRGRGRIARGAVANACEAGALPYVSDIDLRRTPRGAARCG